jgi:hypothetical protein
MASNEAAPTRNKQSFHCHGVSLLTEKNTLYTNLRVITNHKAKNLFIFRDSPDRCMPSKNARPQLLNSF